MTDKYDELIDTVDLFENENVVLMQAEFSDKKVISAGVKNSSGDIVNIIDICQI